MLPRLPSPVASIHAIPSTAPSKYGVQLDSAILAEERHLQIYNELIENFQVVRPTFPHAASLALTISCCLGPVHRRRCRSELDPSRAVDARHCGSHLVHGLHRLRPLRCSSLSPITSHSAAWASPSLCRLSGDQLKKCALNDGVTTFYMEVQSCPALRTPRLWGLKDGTGPTRLCRRTRTCRREHALC